MLSRLLLILVFIPVFTPFAQAAEIHPIKRISDNGMTVLILEQHTLPIVSAEVLVKAGAIYDPDEKGGLANMVAGLLDEGTKRRSSKEIADAVDFIGASLSARAEEDFTTASLKILKKDVGTGFDLLSDILINPAFDPKEVERVRKNILGSILSEKDEPDIVAEKAFDELVFDHHPYHRPANGTEESVPKITRDDLLNFHSTYYRPNNAIISIVGDVTEPEAMGLVKKYFGGWEKKTIRFPKIAPAKPFETKKVKLIDKELTQASVILGNVGIDRSNPDYYSVIVMNYIMGGGGFSSRLLKEIRDNQGLVYSAYSRFSANTFPGPFAVSLQTKNASANAAIRGALAEIRRMRSGLVSERELAEAKDYLMGSFPLRLDTTSKLASVLTAVEYHHLGLDYFERYPQYINKVTREEVLRVAKKYLDPDHYALVVVAKQSEAKIQD
jgi:zinc protease